MRPKITRLAVAALAVAAVATDPPSAHAGVQTPDQRLTDLAQHVTHGWADEKRSPGQLERRLNSGQRVYITCGTVSTLGVRRMQRIGVPARLVSTVTKRAFNAIDNGHTMMEAKIDGRWTLYDLDNNRQPVDSQGHGITVRQFVAMKHRYYRMLAHDKILDLRGSPNRPYAIWAESHLEDWYDRVLGTPLVDASPSGNAGTWIYAAGGRQHQRVESYSASYRWVTNAAMDALYL